MARPLTDHDTGCALCGQPVRLDAFTLATGQGRRRFCCAGCLAIYQFIHVPYRDDPSLTRETKEKPP